MITAMAYIMDEMAKALMSFYIPVVDKNLNGIELFTKFGVSDQMHDYFPFIRSGNKVFVTIAFTMIVLIFIFNILKNFRPGLPREEGLLSHIYRAVCAVVLVAISYELIGFAMQLGYTAIETMQKQTVNFDSTAVTFEEAAKYNIGTDLASGSMEATNSFILERQLQTETSAAMAATIIIPLLIMLAIGWNFIKFFLEITERLVVTTLVTSLAPLGFCAVVSKDTEGITKKYLQMVFSTYMVFVLDVWFMRGFIFSVYKYIIIAKSNGAGGSHWTMVPQDFIWYILLLLAWLIVAQRSDQHLRESGLSVAQTGGNLLGEMWMASRALTGGGMGRGRLASTAARHFLGGGAGGRGGAIPRGKQAGAAGTQMMTKAYGAKSTAAMKNAGFNCFNGSHYAQAITSNGRFSGIEGDFASNDGNSFHAKSVGSRTDAIENGNVPWTNPVDGNTFEISPGHGARDLTAPNGASLDSYDNVDGRFQNAQEVAGRVYDRAGRDEAGLEEAAESARYAAFAGATPEETEMNVQRAMEAGKAMLPESMQDDFNVIGACHDDNGADNVNSLMVQDKATGEMYSFDVTTGRPSENEMFDGRDTDQSIDGVSGFSYTDSNGQQVSGFVSKPITESGAQRYVDAFSSRNTDNPDMAHFEDVRYLGNGRFYANVVDPSSDPRRTPTPSIITATDMCAPSRGARTFHEAGRQFQISPIDVHGGTGTAEGTALRRNKLKKPRSVR